MEQTTVAQQNSCGAPAWLSLLLGILLGAVAGVLLYFGLIPDVQPVLIAFAVFALFVILLIILLMSQGGGVYCLRKYVPWVIVAALALLSLALFALGVLFAPGSILLALFFAVISTFYFMAVFGILFVVLCLLNYIH